MNKPAQYYEDEEQMKEMSKRNNIKSQRYSDLCFLLILVSYAIFGVLLYHLVNKFLLNIFFPI